MKNDLRDQPKDAVPPPRVWNAEAYNKSDLRLKLERKAQRNKERVGKITAAMGKVFDTFSFWRRYMTIPEPGRSLIRGLFVLVALIWIAFAVGGQVIVKDEVLYWYEFAYLVTAPLVVVGGTVFSVLAWMKASS